MVNRHIAEYMASSRRLIIPGVGALVRRTDGGEIVFVEMFKQNDGVLVGLLSQKMDISTEQAGILVERFITELQHDLRYYGYYTIPALGTLRQGEKSITFENDAPAAPQPEQPAPAKEVAPPTPRYEPVVEQEIVAAPQPKAEERVTPKEEVKPAEPKPITKPAEPKQVTTEEKPATKSAESKPAEPTVKPKPAAKAEPKPVAKPTPKKVTPSQESVKFKLYTKEEDIKPQQATQERFRFEAHRDREDNQPQHIRIRTNRKRKKMDPVTLLAIIAAAIAVVVIIYGLVSSPGPVFDEPLLPVEPDTTTLELATPENAQ